MQFAAQLVLVGYRGVGHQFPYRIVALKLHDRFSASGAISRNCNCINIRQSCISMQISDMHPEKTALPEPMFI
jgi:hypothetical protein